jgi:hypothetical protein
MPTDGIVTLPLDVEGRVTLIETGDRLQVERSGANFVVTLPAGTKSETIPVVKIQK